MTSSAPHAGNCHTLTHIQGFCHKTGRNRELGHDNNTQKTPKWQCKSQEVKENHKKEKNKKETEKEGGSEAWHNRTLRAWSSKEKGGL
jgi:hypothetical protein